MLLVAWPEGGRGRVGQACLFCATMPLRCATSCLVVAARPVGCACAGLMVSVAAEVVACFLTCTPSLRFPPAVQSLYRSRHDNVL